jgi:hypothetical protein
VKGDIGLGQVGNGFNGKPCCSIGKPIHPGIISENTE